MKKLFLGIFFLTCSSLFAQNNIKFFQQEYKTRNLVSQAYTSSTITPIEIKQSIYKYRVKGEKDLVISINSKNELKMYNTNRFIVETKDGKTLTNSYLFGNLRLDVLKKYPAINMYIVRANSVDVTSKEDVQRAIGKSVKTVTESYIFSQKTTFSNLDRSAFQNTIPYFNNSFRTDYDTKQWHLINNNSRQNLIDINGVEALSMINNNDRFSPQKQIVVSVIDSGTDYRHPGLRESLWHNASEIPNNRIDDDNNGMIDDYYGWNFTDDNSNIMDREEGNHGTHVAGIIAAKPHRNSNVSGVFPMSKILTCNVGIGNTIFFSSEAIIGALNYSIEKKVDIINMSFGEINPNQELVNIYNSIFQKISAQGIFLVASAGNDGKDLKENTYYPCGSPYVICVANTTSNDELASDSNYDSRSTQYVLPAVNIAAPGSKIYSTSGSPIYTYKSGTSMSAPLVSGAIALLKSVYPTESNTSIIKRLLDTGKELYVPNKYKMKRINLAKALAKKNDEYCTPTRMRSTPFANSNEPNIDGNTFQTAFCICNEQQLKNISRVHMNSTFKLMNDINLSSRTSAIGDGNPFTGNFNGNGYAISNLKSSSGLFNSLERQASIRNLVLDNVEITSNGDVTGALANSSKKYVRVSDVYVTGNISGKIVGGIIGATQQNRLSGCYFSGNLTGSNLTGGIVALDKDSNISYAQFSGNMTSNIAGGIVGYGNNSTVNYSYAEHLRSNGIEVMGGLVGIASCNTVSEKSYSSGFSSSSKFAGGAYGISVSSYLNYVYSTMLNNKHFSNFLLIDKVLDKTYSIGRWYISCNNYTTTKAYQSYFVGLENGSFNYGSPKSQNQMKQKRTFINWFNNGWIIEDGHTPTIKGLPVGISGENN